MDAVVAGRDSIVVLPTGGGKSLCFQVPAVVQQGLALIVSPLISLMKDQGDTLVGNGVPAGLYNSSLDGDGRTAAGARVGGGPELVTRGCPDLRAGRGAWAACARGS